jgi:hypothetical protein
MFVFLGGGVAYSIPDPEARTHTFFTLFFRPFSQMLKWYLYMSYSPFIIYSLSLEVEI